MSCCEHCPTLTDEEREDIAFRTSMAALRRTPLRLAPRAKSTAIREAIYRSRPVVNVVSTIRVSPQPLDPYRPRS